MEGCDRRAVIGGLWLEGCGWRAAVGGLWLECCDWRAAIGGLQRRGLFYTSFWKTLSLR